MPGPDAAYEYNWNSLVGCLQGLLRQAGLPSGGSRVSAVSGEAFRVQPIFDRAGYVPHPLAGLAQDLVALGLRARGGRLGPDRAASATAGVAAGSVVCAGRCRGGGQWRRMGPYRASSGSSWDTRRNAAPTSSRGRSRTRSAGCCPRRACPPRAADWLALVVPQGPALEPAGSDDLAACAAARALQAGAAAGLRRWIALLESGAPIEARVHAYRAQALAAARGEASRFWSEFADGALGRTETRPLAALREPARRQALVCSRFATLFPYPAGGDLAGGGRIVGAGILREVLAVEEELAPLLEAVGAPGPGAID